MSINEPITQSPPRLDRRKVLRAALDIVDRQGLDALSMRRLGAELDADPMIVYHHVGDKEQLLNGIAELLWEEVSPPGESAHPVELLRNLAWSVRGVFRIHPQAAPLILRCSKLVRPFLELLRAYLDSLRTWNLGRDPASILRPVISFALGYGYTETTMLGIQCAPTNSQPLSREDLLLYLGQALPPDIPAELTEAAKVTIADCNPDQCFQDGLELMLAGLSATPENHNGA